MTLAKRIGSVQHGLDATVNKDAGYRDMYINIALEENLKELKRNGKLNRGNRYSKPENGVALNVPEIDHQLEVNQSPMSGKKKRSLSAMAKGVNKIQQESADYITPRMYWFVNVPKLEDKMRDWKRLMTVFFFVAVRRGPGCAASLGRLSDVPRSGSPGGGPLSPGSASPGAPPSLAPCCCGTPWYSRGSSYPG